MADLKTEGRFDQVKGKARSIWGDLNRRRFRQGPWRHPNPYRSNQGEDRGDDRGHPAQAGRCPRR